MKNTMKKALTICLLATMTVMSFGCSSDSADNSNAGDGEPVTKQETISLDQTKQPLTFVHDQDEEKDATEANEEATEAAASAGETAAATTAVSNVEVTEYVPVTDAQGQQQTDAKGQPQTEIVKVTQVVQVTDAQGQAQTDAQGQTQTEVVPVTETAVVTEQPATLSSSANTEYTPEYDSCRAYWLDMSQESDFFFEGEFLVIAFQINENVPNGHYPITIENADIASWDVKKWEPHIINGEISIGEEPAAQEDFPDSDFTLKVNSIKANAGDMALLTIDLKNNPGFCGFVLDIQYDKSAMTIADTHGGKDFTDTAINYVQN